MSCQKPGSVRVGSCVSAEDNLYFCDNSINAEMYTVILEQTMHSNICIKTFPGLSKYFSRQFKTTFCTDYKGMPAEEEGTGLASRECEENFEMANATMLTLYTLRHGCKKNETNS